jgi:hypothetical protein
VTWTACVSLLFLLYAKPTASGIQPSNGCTEAFEHLQKQRSAQADPDRSAYGTVIPFRFCAPPPPGLLQYCDITYLVCFNDCVDSHSDFQFSLFAS